MGFVSMYVGRHEPVDVKGVSQSALDGSQLANPGAHSAASQVAAPSLHVNRVLVSAHDLSPHPPQLASVPSIVSQPSLPGTQSANGSEQVVMHLPC